jgi:hypothetical protein
MSKETILVTGGAGFIGSHLCLRLFDEGYRVICLDNYFTGSRINFGERHEELVRSGRFEFIRHDVVEPIILEIDQIYHLACPASPVHYQYNPVKTIKTNVLGSYHMLGLAKRVKARILMASTSEIYGDPQVHPQPESYWGHVNPIGIRSCYDEGKRVAETMCASCHGLSYIAFRNIGDAASVFAQGGRVMTASYRWPIQSHASMGPSCAVADIRASGGTVWTAAQGTHRLRQTIAQLLGLDVAKLRLIYQDGSGSYGGNGNDDVAFEAALISRRGQRR